MGGPGLFFREDEVMGRISLFKQREREFHKHGRKGRRQAKRLNDGEGKDKGQEEKSCHSVNFRDDS
jgi:hypothetical protein